jgi:hypothetical protein
MPRKVDYPRATINNCLDLAKAVDQLGGISSFETCAEHMGKKVSGAFNAIIHTSTKFGFTTNKSGQLQTTDLYKNYKLAYNDNEKREILRKAVFNVPVFRQLYEKFKEVKLPVKMLDKILVREFDVDDNYGGRVAKYFVEAAKLSHLLRNDFTFTSDTKEEKINEETLNENQESINDIKIPDVNKIPAVENDLNYKVDILGPGMNSSIEINEEEDFIILEAMIKKIRKKFDNRDE